MGWSHKTQNRLESLDTIPSRLQYASSLHNEPLSVEHSVLLQHLKIVFLIGGVLVNHKDVGVQLGDDEAQVKLTDNLHFLKHVLTTKK